MALDRAFQLSCGAPEIVERGQTLRAKGLTLATMESCTGGMLANVITNVPGSSAYFRGGLVSYATEMKTAWGVGADTIEEFGAVSAETTHLKSRY